MFCHFPRPLPYAHNNVTAVKNGGGGGTFHFHQDGQYTRFFGPAINFWVALTDVSPENGCLLVVPRTHLWGRLEPVESPDQDGHKTIEVEPTEYLPVRLRAGDAVAFTILIVHASGPNTTDAPRIGYAIQFHQEDTVAVWDNQPPRLLREHQRWATTTPVDKITVQST